MLSVASPVGLSRVADDAGPPSPFSPVLSYEPAIVVVAVPTTLATTLSAELDTSTVPPAAAMPCGLSKDVPGGAVNVTALMVKVVRAEAGATMPAAVVTTVPDTATAAKVSRVRRVVMVVHLSVGPRVKGLTAHRYPASVTLFGRIGDPKMK